MEKKRAKAAIIIREELKWENIPELQQFVEEQSWEGGRIR
jgi:hypothetical protein